MCVRPRPRIHSLCRDSKLQLLFTPSPHASAGRKPAQRVCVSALYVFVCVCVCAGEGTSGLVHIILNRIFPSRVLLPPSFRAFLRVRLFVLERHCSGAAEAMSQRHCHSLRPPATHCSIIK